MPDPNDYTVGWICAISTELTAAALLLDEQHPTPESVAERDENNYILGRIGKHQVAIAVLPEGEYGTACASSVATSMLHTFPNIRIGLMFGIGGGAPSQKNDIRLGDVVVSIPRNGSGGVFQYDFGKTIQNQAFHHTAFLNQPPPVVRTAVSSLATRYELDDGSRLNDMIDSVLRTRKKRQKYGRPPIDRDRLYRSDFLHTSDSEANCAASCGDESSKTVQRDPRPPDEDKIVIHYGIIASGDKLMKDAILRDRLSKEKGVLCFAMEAAGLMNRFPCLVVRGICDYSDTHKNDDWQGYAAMAAATYAKDLLRQIPTTRVEAERKISDTISDLTKRVAIVSDHMLDIKRGILISGLRHVKGAAYDSHANAIDPICHPDTRVDLFDQIWQWIHNHDEKPIFWLQGMAGTGKSTIARTLAKKLDEESNLGASFFFKRGEGDRGRAEYFFTTICQQLCERDYLFAQYFQQAIELSPNIADKSINIQFEQLIMEPLQKLGDSNTSTSKTVVIIDALDECDPEDNAGRIIKLLSLTQRLPKTELKFFVTSRPETYIRLGLEDIKDSYKDVALHKIPEPVIEHDISIYLEHELAIIRDEYNRLTCDELHLSNWPARGEIQILVRMAVPLFIFAATVCRFLRDTTASDPTEKLARLLERPFDTYRDKLAATYGPVLDRLVAGKPGPEKTHVLSRFRDVVGPVILLAEPLTISSLASLLVMDLRDVESIFRPLHSVLQVPSDLSSPVKTLHLSFCEFLVDSESPRNEFWINKEETNERLAFKCLELLSTTQNLRYNMCELKSFGKLRDEIPQELVDHSLSAEVQYSCLYWAYHLKECKVQPDDLHPAYEFLQKYFLNWLEALSLMGKISDSIRLILELQTIVHAKNGTRMLEFLHDAQRFVLRFRSTIDTTPLQRPIMEDDWSPCLQTLEGHNGCVWSVAFSGNGSLIASGSEDRTIKVWDTATAKLRYTIKYGGFVSDVAFSRDDDLIASASPHKTIKIWDAVTGQLQRTFQDHSDLVRAVAFSKVGGLVASGSSNVIIKVWDTETGELRYTLEHGERVHCLAFSSGGNLIASASWRGSIKLWDSVNGTLQRTIEDACRCFAFSPDGNLIASVSVSGIKIWETKSGTLWRNIHHVVHYSPRIAVSSDGKLIALTSDERILIWNATTGKLHQTLQGHTSSVQSISFSPNSNILVSGSADAKIKIWDMTKEAAHNRQEFHGPLAHAIIFSTDSKLIASGFTERKAFSTVNIWDATNGTIRYSFRSNRHYIESFVCSADSELMAVGLQKGKLEIWDATNGTTRHSLSGNSGFTTSLAFSCGSKRIAAGSKEGVINIWNCRDGSIQYRVDLRIIPTELSFSTSGSHLLVGLDFLEIKIDTSSRNDNSQHEIQTTKAPYLCSPSMGLQNQSLTLIETNRSPRYSIDHTETWIQCDGQNVLWLPPDYRPAHHFDEKGPWDISPSGNRIGVCSNSGQIFVFEFSW